jgi:hypothetical protein
VSWWHSLYSESHLRILGFFVLFTAFCSSSTRSAACKVLSEDFSVKQSARRNFLAGGFVY